MMGGNTRETVSDFVVSTSHACDFNAHALQVVNPSGATGCQLLKTGLFKVTMICVGVSHSAVNQVGRETCTDVQRKEFTINAGVAALSCGERTGEETDRNEVTCIVMLQKNSTKCDLTGVCEEVEILVRVGMVKNHTAGKEFVHDLEVMEHFGRPWRKTRVFRFGFLVQDATVGVQ